MGSTHATPTIEKIYAYHGGSKSMETYSATLLQATPLYQSLLIPLSLHESELPSQADCIGQICSDYRKQSHKQSIQMLLQFLQYKCFHLYTHSLRVQYLACSLAQSLSLSEAEISSIELAALFHDIGKTLLSNDILQKAGKLTHQEFEELKQHSEYGARLLRWMKMPEKMVPLVYHHHEHWDGSGYPDGITGHTIPLGARIIALSDAFDAMISCRPYQHPYTSAQALAELQRCAGSQFDPFLASRFYTMLLTKEVPASI
jgi:putative nucleotidyltransferase with HDIG domain